MKTYWLASSSSHYERKMRSALLHCRYVVVYFEADATKAIECDDSNISIMLAAIQCCSYMFA